MVWKEATNRDGIKKKEEILVYNVSQVDQTAASHHVTFTNFSCTAGPSADPLGSLQSALASTF